MVFNPSVLWPVNVVWDEIVAEQRAISKNKYSLSSPLEEGDERGNWKDCVVPVVICLVIFYIQYNYGIFPSSSN